MHRRPRHLRWAALAVLPLVRVADGVRRRQRRGGLARPRSARPPPLTGGSPRVPRTWSGRWAHFDVVAYADPSMNTGIISTGFADLELRDGELWNQMTFCHADTVTDQPIEVSISDAATQAITPVATPVEVTEVDGELQLSRPPTPTPIGIRLEDPANESLPDDPNDPRIFDADGDGNPGVTSTVKVSDDLQGEIYLARREIFAYDVTQVDPDRLEGSITDSSEQLILGASNPALPDPRPVGPGRRPGAEPGHLGARRRRLGLRPPRSRTGPALPAQPGGGLVGRRWRGVAVNRRRRRRTPRSSRWRRRRRW